MFISDLVPYKFRKASEYDLNFSFLTIEFKGRKSLINRYLRWNKKKSLIPFFHSVSIVRKIGKKHIYKLESRKVAGIQKYTVES